MSTSNKCLDVLVERVRVKGFRQKQRNRQEQELMCRHRQLRLGDIETSGRPFLAKFWRGRKECMKKASELEFSRRYWTV